MLGKLWEHQMWGVLFTDCSESLWASIRGLNPAFPWLRMWIILVREMDFGAPDLLVMTPLVSGHSCFQV